MKLCIVCSAGGHLFEAVQLRSMLCDHELIWVTFKKEDALSILKGEDVIWAYYPTQKNIVNLIRNFFLAWRFFRLRKIEAVLSTGAGVAFPFFLLSKLQGRKTIYIESIARINDLSLTGRLLYHISDYFIVQWPELSKKYPKAIYKGRLL